VGRTKLVVTDDDRRHRFDFARFADSNGREGDQARPTACRYRDFVIRALNDDPPFDEFVRRQPAGDEMGVDHTRLTYLHDGRRYRLTDVAGNVLTKIPA